MTPDNSSLSGHLLQSYDVAGPRMDCTLLNTTRQIKIAPNASGPAVHEHQGPVTGQKVRLHPLDLIRLEVHDPREEKEMNQR